MIDRESCQFYPYLLYIIASIVNYRPPSTKRFRNFSSRAPLNAVNGTEILYTQVLQSRYHQQGITYICIASVSSSNFFILIIQHGCVTFKGDSTFPANLNLNLAMICKASITLILTYLSHLENAMKKLWTVRISMRIITTKIRKNQGIDYRRSAKTNYRCDTRKLVSFFYKALPAGRWWTN